MSSRPSRVGSRSALERVHGGMCSGDWSRAVLADPATAGEARRVLASLGAVLAGDATPDALCRRLGEQTCTPLLDGDEGTGPDAPPCRQDADGDPIPARKLIRLRCGSGQGRPRSVVCWNVEKLAERLRASVPFRRRFSPHQLRRIDRAVQAVRFGTVPCALVGPRPGECRRQAKLRRRGDVAPDDAAATRCEVTAALGASSSAMVAALTSAGRTLRRALVGARAPDGKATLCRARRAYLERVLETSCRNDADALALKASASAPQNRKFDGTRFVARPKQETRSLREMQEAVFDALFDRYVSEVVPPGQLHLLESGGPVSGAVGATAKKLVPAAEDDPCRPAPAARPGPLGRDLVTADPDEELVAGACPCTSACSASRITGGAGAGGTWCFVDPKRCRGRARTLTRRGVRGQWRPCNAASDTAEAHAALAQLDRVRWLEDVYRVQDRLLGRVGAMSRTELCQTLRAVLRPPPAPPVTLVSRLGRAGAVGLMGALALAESLITGLGWDSVPLALAQRLNSALPPQARLGPTSLRALTVLSNVAAAWVLGGASFSISWTRWLLMFPAGWRFLRDLVLGDPVHMAMFALKLQLIGIPRLGFVRGIEPLAGSLTGPALQGSLPSVVTDWVDVDGKVRDLLGRVVEGSVGDVQITLDTVPMPAVLKSRIRGEWRALQCVLLRGRRAKKRGAPMPPLVGPDLDPSAPAA